MDTISSVRKNVDVALGDVLERRRTQSAGWPGPAFGFGGDAAFGLIILVIVFIAWVIREWTPKPAMKPRVATIEQTDNGISLIDTHGQREFVPREALRLQVAGLWEPRRLLILKTWANGPASQRRSIALGTVAWVPIQSEATVQEWESFLGLKVDSQVAMGIA